MFKRLNSEDIVVGTFPIIEPAGTDDGGVVVANTDYEQDLAMIGGSMAPQRIYRQLAHLIQGDATSELPIGPNAQALTFIRNSFK